MERRRGVQSIEVGADLLRALAVADEPQTLGALARAAGMTAGKAHRYLVSYVHSGLVVQIERNGTYDLGPLAVRIGLAAIHRHDTVRVAMSRLADLRDEINETVTLAVWADGGPVVAKHELSTHPVTLAVRVGTTYSILNTATGRIFLAFGERALLAPLIAGEIAAFRAAGVRDVPLEGEAVDELAAEVRNRRLSRVDQLFLVGVCAVGAPVFDPGGRLVAAVTVVGRSGSLDLRWDGPVARALEAFTTACSDGPPPEENPIPHRMTRSAL